MPREQFTTQEISDCMFRQKDNKTEANELTTAKLVYTIIGKQDNLVDGFPILDNTEILAEDRDIAYAIRNNRKYFIKTNGGQLIDPLGIYQDKDLYKKVGDTSVWKWKEVNHKVFNMYIRYLKTKNQVHYRQASREIF